MEQLESTTTIYSIPNTTVYHLCNVSLYKMLNPQRNSDYIQWKQNIPQITRCTKTKSSM